MTQETRKPRATDRLRQAAGGIVGAIAGAAIGITAGVLGVVLGGIAGFIAGRWAGRALAALQLQRRSSLRK